MSRRPTTKRAAVDDAYRYALATALATRTRRLRAIERRLRRRYARRLLNAGQLVTLAATRAVLATRDVTPAPLPPGPGLPVVEAPR